MNFEAVYLIKKKKNSNKQLDSVCNLLWNKMS